MSPGARAHYHFVGSLHPHSSLYPNRGGARAWSRGTARGTSDNWSARELAAQRCALCDAVTASVTLKPSNRAVDLMRILERAAHVVRGQRP